VPISTARPRPRSRSCSLKLANSKIELDLPLVGQFPLVPQADAGIEPDVPVAVTLEDIAVGRDAEMAKMRALLRATP
jgi:hypothetical protein